MAQLVSPEAMHAEGMAGWEDVLYMDGLVASTRSNPMSGAGAATVSRPGPEVELVPATLGGGRVAVIPDSIELYEQTAFPVLFYEAFLMGSLDTATAIFTDGVAAPTRLAGGINQQIPLQLYLETDTDCVSNRTVQATYVNEAGVAGQLTTSHALTVNALGGSGGFFALAGSDVGVLDVTACSCTGGTAPTGLISLWGILPITIVPNLGAGTTAPILAEGVVRRIAAGQRIRGMVLGAQTLGRSGGTIHYVVDTV